MLRCQKNGNGQEKTKKYLHEQNLNSFKPNGRCASTFKQSEINKNI